MTMLTKIAVPDLGEFKNVPIVDIPVAVGDEIAIGDTLIVVESDKATLDVPSDFAGVVTSILVALGDKVSQGSILAEIRMEAGLPRPPSLPRPKWRRQRLRRLHPQRPHLSRRFRRRCPSRRPRRSPLRRRFNL
ncbi:biotin/lipoyl-containing protein [Paracoccus cavernae]